MKNNHLLILLLLIANFGCQHKNNNITQKHIPQHSLPINFDYELILLETKENCLIGDITSATLFEDRLFLLDSYKSKALYVFDLNGNYITQIGKLGESNEEYIFPINFKIIDKERILILNDGNRNRLLFYDIDNYQFIKSIKTPFKFSDFEKTSNNNYVWLSFTSFDETKNQDYILYTDSVFKPIQSSWKADFKSGYSSFINPNFIYRNGEDLYAYHFLYPFIYKMNEKNDFAPYIELKFENKSFAPLSYIKKISSNNTNYITKLNNSKYISTYTIYETEDLLCIVYIYEKIFYISLYDKIKNKSYNYSIYEFNKMFNMNSIIIPIGSSKQHIIGKIDAVEIEKYKFNTDNDKLKTIINNIQEESNPIICLFKLFD